MVAAITTAATVSIAVAAPTAPNVQNVHELNTVATVAAQTDVSAHEDLLRTWLRATTDVYDEVRIMIERMRNKTLAALAETNIRSLLNAAHTYQARVLPPISATEDAYDGALLIEWIFPGRRIGLTIDLNPDETGWYYVASDACGGVVHSGGMESFDPFQLVAWALRET
ncbi:hypothetical protein [Polyangium jinanense]|uniref:Uncharacterized protein n=1 Tax=Polyangium jinanense TaxID=2829994 RepID=A0A9X3XIM0_9BACT|nr:hypothetical protein [Polyangium jinanense]MDC3962653.1 hypothetical protein [Polyangium jinanense]MDC3989373.1 hypothetical protein [Polyangium jinanense]